MNKHRKIAIVGCGHTGKLLAQSLLDVQHTVKGYVASERSAAECRRRGIDCTIITLDEPPSFELDIDLESHIVIYLVPPPRSGRSDTRIKNFLGAIEKHSPERFVLISTTGVYGDCNGTWVDESTPLNPLAERAHRRADAEKQARQFCRQHEIPLVILRVPGIYGPGKLPLARISSGEPIVNQQDSPYTNRIHIDDLVTICETAILSEHISGIYNVSDGHPGTMYDYFIAVAAAMNLSPPPAIPLAEARSRLSEGMLSYMAESRRIDNTRLLDDFRITLHYPDLQSGLNMLHSEHHDEEID